MGRGSSKLEPLGDSRRGSELGLSDAEQRTLLTYERSAADWASRRSRETTFWAPEFEQFQQLQASGSVLDVGSGHGRDAILLSEHGYAVTGLDVSSALIEIARERCPQTRFVHGSVYRMPFAEQEFDAGWAVASLLHVPKERMQEALVEIRRVLKDGATLFVALKTGEGEQVLEDGIGERFFSFWQPKEFAVQLAQAGFEVVSHHQREAAGTNWLCLFARRA